jgi:TatD DNase family protein
VAETDSPYLPPQQIRGKRNEPANVVEAVRAIAAARTIAVEAAAAATFENASRLLGINAAAEAATA